MPPPTQAEIYDRATQFKDDLIANERRASVRIVDAYGRAFDKMKDNIRVLTEKIEQARLSGQYISPSWAFQIDRYQALQRQIATEIGRIASQVNDATIKQQADAVKRAAGDIEDLTNMAAQNAGVSVSFSRLASSASESIVGFLSDGSPLKSLLDQLPGLAGQAVATALTDAIIRGQNPTRTASQIRTAIGGNMNRALTIARTETMRAYREASHRSLTQNGDILQGWVWVASFSRRTCASCLALAGSVHRLEERMESHPRCRCSQAPLIRGQKVEFEKGEDWFRRQDASTQHAILGSNVALNAYRRGDATLLDFVGRQNSPKWGQPYYQISTRRAILKQGAFPGYNHPTQFITLDEIFRRGGITPPTPDTGPIQPVSPAPPVVTTPSKKPRATPARKKATVLTAPEVRAKLQELKTEYEPKLEAATKATNRAFRQYRLDSSLHPQYLAAVNTEKALVNEYNKLAHKLVSVAKPAQFSVVQSTREKNNPRIQEGLKRFGNLVSRDILGKKSKLSDASRTVAVNSIGNRSYYHDRAIYIRTPVDEHVVVHELGHWLEDIDSDIFDKVSAFYDRRTAGESLISMNAASNTTRFRANEMTKVDRFINAYMGKYYYQGNKRYASEILSMGLEQLSRDPVAFAQADPDMFDFIYGIVRK